MEPKSLKYTYPELRAYLDEHGTPGDTAHGEGMSAELPSLGLSIHDHPGSGRSRQIHFMVNGVKIAELGPPTDEGEEVAPGYVDFLAEWDGQPVHAYNVKLRIALDNGLVPDPERAMRRAAREFGENHGPVLSHIPWVDVFAAGWKAAEELMTR